MVPGTGSRTSHSASAEHRAGFPGRRLSVALTFWLNSGLSLRAVISMRTSVGAGRPNVEMEQLYNTLKSYHKERWVECLSVRCEHLQCHIQTPNLSRVRNYKISTNNLTATHGLTSNSSARHSTLHNSQCGS